MSTTILLKRGLDAQIETLVLKRGELAFAHDTEKLYAGTSSAVEGGVEKVLINPDQGSASDYNVGTEEGNIPVLGEDGKLPDSVIPAIALSDTFVVETADDLLSLDAQKGDIGIVADESQTYVLSTDDPTKMIEWIPLKTPEDAVLSVNGEKGVVVLTGKMISLGAYEVVTDSVFTFTEATQVTDSIHAIDEGVTDIEARVTTLEEVIDGGTF